MIERRAFIGTLAGGFLAAPLAAEAQPAGKVYRVGILVVANRRVRHGHQGARRGRLRHEEPSTLEARPPHYGALIWNLVQVLDKLERGAL